MQSAEGNTWKSLQNYPCPHPYKHATIHSGINFLFSRSAFCQGSSFLSVLTFFQKLYAEIPIQILPRQEKRQESLKGMTAPARLCMGALLRRPERRSMNEPIPANREYKDSVFRMLYNDPETVLPLYNALNGTDYKNPQMLTVTTLENALYLGMRNDVSFLLDSRMTLYEHQSTWNPNLPLRDLFYIARLMEKYVNVRRKSLYSSTLIRLPAPRFVVFYNGLKDTEDDLLLRLSDAYERAEAEPELELIVRLININPGHNPELMKRCRTLREYSEFVARILKCTAEENSFPEAVERAVTECIREGILADFLLCQKSEVIAMSIFEYDHEEELEKLGAMEHEEGVAEGRGQAILLLLSLRGSVPGWLKEHILKETNISTLDGWIRAVGETSSIKGFLAKTGLREA